MKKKEHCITTPSTVKDALELFLALYMSNIKHIVLEQIETMIKEYLKDTKVLKYNNESSNLTLFLVSLLCMHEEFPPNPTIHDDFEHLIEGKAISCIDEFTQIIVYTLHMLHSTFQFLKLNIDTERNYGGRRRSILHNKSASLLQKWLTGELKTNGDLFPIGLHRFTNQSKTEYGFYGILGLCINFETGGSLQHALVGAFFLAKKWHHSYLANSVSFLRAFCEAFTERLFHPHLKGYDRYASGLEHISAYVVKQLKPITATTDDGILYALYSGSSGLMYKNNLVAHKFEKYVDWLLSHFEDMITSLKQMSKDCEQWYKDKLKDATTTGPFKYGFAFKDLTWDKQSVHMSIKDAILTFTDEGLLKKLLNHLVDALKDQQASSHQSPMSLHVSQQQNSHSAQNKQDNVMHVLQTSTTSSSSTANIGTASGALFGVAAVGVGIYFLRGMMQ